MLAINYYRTLSHVHLGICRSNTHGVRLVTVTQKQLKDQSAVRRTLCNNKMVLMCRRYPFSSTHVVTL